MDRNVAIQSLQGNDSYLFKLLPPLQKHLTKQSYIGCVEILAQFMQGIDKLTREKQPQAPYIILILFCIN